MRQENKREKQKRYSQGHRNTGIHISYIDILDLLASLLNPNPLPPPKSNRSVRMLRQILLLRRKIEKLLDPRERGL